MPVSVLSITPEYNIQSSIESSSQKTLTFGLKCCVFVSTYISIKQNNLNESGKLQNHSS